MSTPLPTLYLSHGSPMIALEPGPAGHFMQRLGPAITQQWGRPRAIVVMSPHTATATPFVLGGAQHEAIHDFGGFPPELDEVHYDAAGEPAVAQRVADLLNQAGVPAQWTPHSGLDHGIWTVLMHLFPQVDVPVVPLSLVPSASPSDLLAMLPMAAGAGVSAPGDRAPPPVPGAVRLKPGRPARWRGSSPRGLAPPSKWRACRPSGSLCYATEPRTDRRTRSGPEA